MIFRTKGIPVNIRNYLIGTITRNSKRGGEHKILIVPEETFPLNHQNYLAIITSAPTLPSIEYQTGYVYGVLSLDHLEEGDIVLLGEDGNIKTMYRANSFYNTILATERCNSNCLMCSQPPKDKNDVPTLFEIYSKVIPLIPKDCFELTISGGEPTLMGEYFFNLVEQITVELPNTELHILTNGRTFAWEHMAERIAQIDNPRMMLGIPLYADYYQIHDYIVQAKDAFNQTMIGLHNLARYCQRVEIRIVLHKQSIPRLAKLSRYIYKNLPFAEHVTFMGLEYTGYTPHNIDTLWIDPFDYKDELEESVEFLARQGMNVSIYNSQLCILPESLWHYAKKSISDWKNDYLPVCQECDKLHDCGGLFTWNLKKCSDHIRPIKSEYHR